MFDKVHSGEKTKNERIARQTLATEILGDNRQERTRVGNLNSVIKHFYRDTSPLFIIVTMSQGINDSFLKNFQRYFPHFFSRTNTLNFICNLQFTLQPFNSLVVLLQKRATEGFIIKNIHLVCSFK